MKNEMNLLLILITIFIVSCNFNPFQTSEEIWESKVYTIDELFNAELAEDGETYIIEGYIYEFNYSREYEDFFLYSDERYKRDLTYNHLDVSVVKHLNSIFNKINEAFENTDGHWIKVRIQAEAKEVMIAGNGWSDYVFVLEADALKIDD
jgi:hypothetical protein